jgi:hypothetical protein
MPIGSFDLSPVPGGQATQALPIIVALFQPGEDNPYTILPNVRCLRIDYREGPEPPLARFQYLMGDLFQVAVGWPAQFERLWPIDAQGSYVVLTDDRLVVLTQIPPAEPDGDPKVIVLFDGFAQVPQADLSGAGQSVTFVAVGVAARLWDSPIKNRVQRDATGTGTTDGSADVEVELPCRFNPADNSVGSEGGYVGNRVADTEYTVDGDNKFPVFLDPLCVERNGGFGFDVGFWTVADALKYLIEVHPSPVDEEDFPYVEYPPFDTLDIVLTTDAPPNDGILNSGDAVSSDVKIRDYDASNRAVPDVMAELLRYCGFTMAFYIDTDPDGFPETHLRIVRRDGLAKAAPKLLYLAAAGTGTLNLAANNVTELHLARDMNDLMNQWTVETALKQYEITVRLAPGFELNTADAANRKPFILSNMTDATGSQRRMYRWWIADECNDGHWNMLTSKWVATKTTNLFASIFPPKDGLSTYVDRYRPGSNTLISKDAEGKPLKAVLEIFQGGYSEDPELETELDNGQWLTIPHGHGWRLLEDRLGIEITVNDPEEWTTGMNASPDGTHKAIPKVSTVTWTATPTQQTAFELRLTTVVEGDQRIDHDAVTAKARVASPTLFDRERSIDGKDHFQKCLITKSSRYYETQRDKDGNAGDGSNPLVVRDDSAAAKTHAEQLRAAHEFPTLAGSATVPFITDYYQIGDRVKIVRGRNASLQVNVAVDQGEAPTYPWITAFAWDFTGDQQRTVLQFSDRRAERQGI